MQVLITKNEKLAINCRDIVSLKKGDIVKCGDMGLTGDNLKRIIELNFGEIYSGKVGVEPEKEEFNQGVIDGEPIEIEIDDSPEFVIDKITDKDDLEEYALTFNIELDKRKSLKNMKKELLKELNNDI